MRLFCRYKSALVFMEIKMLGYILNQYQHHHAPWPKDPSKFLWRVEEFPPLKNYQEVAKYRLCEPPSAFSSSVGCHGYWPTRWPPRDMPSSRGASLGWKRMGGTWKARHLWWPGLYFFLRRKYNGACVGREGPKYDYRASGFGVIVGCFETYHAFASFHRRAAPAILTCRGLFHSGGPRMFPYLAFALDCVWIDCFSRPCHCAGFCFEGWN